MQQDKLSILPILQQVPFFLTLKEEDHREIIKHIEYQLYPPGYAIFNEGDMGDKMYFIRKGQVQVVRKAEGSEDVVANLGLGDFFGEMALISDEPRNASVKTIAETEVFTLSKYDLFHLIQNNADMASRINKKYLDRFNQNDLKEMQDSM